MAKILLVSLLMASAVTFAQTHGAGLTYEATPGWRSPSRLDLLELQGVLQSKGYAILDQRNAGRMTWIPVDQIYTSPDLRRTIFVKFGLRLADRAEEGKLLKGKIGYLYHARTKDGEPFAMFFNDVPESEASAIIQILPSTRASRISGFSLSLLPEARAEELAETTDSKTQTSGSGTLLSAEALSTCTGSAWEGAKHSALETWSTAKQLLTDPWGFWGSVKKKFAEFKDLLRNFDAEMSQLIEALSNADRETALVTACTVAGQAAFSALLMAGGVGAVKGAANLAKIVLELREARAVLLSVARLRAMGKADSTMVKQIVTGALSCAGS